MVIFLVALASTSCVGAVSMFPTETPTSNPTSEPTRTPIPTATESPTITPTVVPKTEPIQSNQPIVTARIPLRLGRVETIEEGGFSFRPPIGYQSTYQNTQVTLTSDDGDTVISLIGGRADHREDLEADLDYFIGLISKEIEINPGASYQYLVDGFPGLAAEITGMWGEIPITGRILIVAPSEEQIFYALAISPDTIAGFGWEPEGRQAFEAIIDSITFHEPFQP
jgi:hypothetical protein